MHNYKNEGIGMTKYSISEKPVFYKVLLYSDNPDLINHLNKNLNKEGISLSVKNIGRSSGYEQPADKNRGSVLKTIYDFSTSDIEQSKTVKGLNELSENLILIFKNKNLNKFKKIKQNNKIILVEKLSKKTHENIVNYILNNLTDRKGEVVLFGEINKWRYRYSKKTQLMIILILVFIYPFLTYLYSFFTLIIFGSNIYKNIPLERIRELSVFDSKVRAVLYRTNKTYIKTPFIKYIYLETYKYTEKEYRRSVFRLETIHKILKLNQSFNNIFKNKEVGEREFEYSTSNILDTSLLSEGDRPEDLIKINRLLDRPSKIINILDNYVSREPVYFLLIWQENKTLAPTGGRSGEIAILSLKENKLEIIGKTSGKDLHADFKGSINSIYLYEKPYLYLQDAVVDLKDKLDVYSLMVESVYNIDISGTLIIEKSGKEDIGKIVDLIDQKMSFEDSFDLYQKINNILDNNNLSFYFIEGNNSYTKDSVLEINEHYDDKKCFNNEFYFAEVSDNVQPLSASTVKILGKHEQNMLNIDIFYSNGAGAGDRSLLIYPPDGVKNTLNTEKKSLTKIITYKNKELTENTYNDLVINALVAKYSIPLIGCDKGYGVKILNQPGNDRMHYELEIRSPQTSYLYVDSLLTSWGNKFYNSGLVPLNKNTKFEFIYKK